MKIRLDRFVSVCLTLCLSITAALGEQQFIYIHLIANDDIYEYQTFKTATPGFVALLHSHKLGSAAPFEMAVPNIEELPQQLLSNIESRFYIDKSGNEVAAGQNGSVPKETVAVYGTLSDNGHAVVSGIPGLRKQVDGLEAKIGGLGGETLLGLVLTMVILSLLAAPLLRNRRLRTRGKYGKQAPPDPEADGPRQPSNLDEKIVAMHKELSDPYGGESTVKSRLVEIHDVLRKSGIVGSVRQEFEKQTKGILSAVDSLEKLQKALDGATLKLEPGVRNVQSELLREILSAKAGVDKMLNETQGLMQQSLQRIDSLAKENQSLRSSLLGAGKELREDIERRLWSTGEADIPNFSEAISAVGAQLTKQRNVLQPAGAAASTEYINQCLREIETIQKCARIATDRDWSRIEDLRTFADPLRRILLDDAEPVGLGACGEAERMLQHLRRRLSLELDKAGCHVERPVPGTTNFNAQLHRMIPNLNRTTQRADLADIVCERAQSGIYVDSGGSRRILVFAEVGRYVLDSSSEIANSVESRNRIELGTPTSTAVKPQSAYLQDGSGEMTDVKELQTTTAPPENPQGAQSNELSGDSDSKMNAIKPNSTGE